MNSDSLEQVLEKKLRFVYPKHNAAQVAAEILQVLGQRKSSSTVGSERWSERSNLLITYADTVHGEGAAPLRVQHEFLVSKLGKVLRHVHLLPFYPWTSDDGFSVADYLEVDPAVGDWGDVKNLSKDFSLMFDLVLNHCSASHQWFADYRTGRNDRENFFIEADPSLDYSGVTRPRSLPLLTPYETSHGLKHLWTTFSADQIDLNYAEPKLLLEMCKILLEYLSYGAKIVRFDAPTYLWKELGTSCVSLPQTHEVMKIFRIIFDAVAPDAIVLTETNVPHQENISYFGAGDEAHMVYNFSLPPLLVHGLRNRTSKYLKQWAAGLGDLPQGCTFLNFTASHDGIGVRGLKDIVPDSEIAELCAKIKELGGGISTRRLSDGSDAPYEMNISYIDALAAHKDEVSDELLARFLTSQQIAIAFKGVPAIYIQSLIGGRNDYVGLAKTGRARSINRKKWDKPELDGHLRGKFAEQVLQGIRHALAVRNEEPAFHPDGSLTVLDTPDSVFAFRREFKGRKVIAVSNFSSAEVEVSSLGIEQGVDLLTGEAVGRMVRISPFRTRWVNF